ISSACSLPLALPVSAVYNLPSNMLAEAKQPPPMLVRHFTVKFATFAGERMVSLGFTPWCAASKRKCVQSPLAIDTIIAIATQANKYTRTRPPPRTSLARLFGSIILSTCLSATEPLTAFRMRLKMFIVQHLLVVLVGLHTRRLATAQQRLIFAPSKAISDRH